MILLHDTATNGRSGMVEMVQNHLHQQGGATVSAEDVVSALNAAQQVVQPEILEADPNYMSTDYALSIVANTREYLLPPDAMSVKLYPDTQGCKQGYVPRNEIDINNTIGNQAFSTRRVRDDLYLVLSPTPTAGSTLTIQYTRRLPNLHYGKASSVSGTAFGLRTGGAYGAGKVWPILNFYKNARVMITGGDGLGQIRTISSNTAAGVATLDSAWSVTAPTTASTYEIMCEVPSSWHMALVWKADAHYAEQSGMKDMIEYFEARYQEAKAAAIVSLGKTNRSMEPPIPVKRSFSRVPRSQNVVPYNII